MDDESARSPYSLYEIYRRFCAIRVGTPYHYSKESNTFFDESEKGSNVKHALTNLSMSIGLMFNASASLLEQLEKLMSQLNLMGDFTEFSNFYDFVFFICRESGQKRITVSRAISAWRLVLDGRFRLLNYWCDFVEKNQRHNISEDTWHQVLSFSRCVHEDLEGYDSAGAWPVLIDDFVEHMYRITGSNDCVRRDATCSCRDSECAQVIHEDSLPGLKKVPGLKRKLSDVDMVSVFPSKCIKPEKQTDVHKDSRPFNDCDDFQAIAKQTGPFCVGMTSCAVEGFLSKGFAGLLSSWSSVQFDQERPVSCRIE